MTISTNPKNHPATFNAPILKAIREALGRPSEMPFVLDPFAGVGGIHELREYGFVTVGIEREPEWAAASPYTRVGTALALPFHDGFFHAIATSPTYGNRMADTYDGRDGSKRATYRIALGRPLSEDNSGSLQWGEEYRDFHRSAWEEAIRVLQPGGRFILNSKDHYRRGELQRVTDWHLDTLKGLGLEVIARHHVPSPGNRFGANGNLRVSYEEVVRLDKPRSR